MTRADKCLTCSVRKLNNIKLRRSPRAAGNLLDEFRRAVINHALLVMLRTDRAAATVPDLAIRQARSMHLPTVNCDIKKDTHENDIEFESNRVSFLECSQGWLNSRFDAHRRKNLADFSGQGSDESRSWLCRTQ